MNQNIVYRSPSTPKSARGGPDSRRKPLPHHHSQPLSDEENRLHPKTPCPLTPLEYPKSLKERKGHIPCHNDKCPVLSTKLSMTSTENGTTNCKHSLLMPKRTTTSLTKLPMITSQENPLDIKLFLMGISKCNKGVMLQFSLYYQYSLQYTPFPSDSHDPSDLLTNYAYLLILLFILQPSI